ncbi:hypothetical protein A9Q99_23785 [Gammaproteobacteria bacterium 45_16_T64]|nr:hypothetical protein A9Q99_23785 [Gammaproteobacteria bacterium 45_16_T64]
MKGQCLCGGIAFSAQEMPGKVVNCHCSRCRVSHGADYATQAFAVRSSLVFERGEALLKEYQSTGGIRTFCSHCGSRLMNYAPNNGDYLSIATACLDENYTRKAVSHCYTGSKAVWHEPSVAIPSHDELPSDLF